MSSPFAHSTQARPSLEVAQLLDEVAFKATMLAASRLIRALLVDAGFAVGEWSPLSPSCSGLVQNGYCASLQDHAQVGESAKATYVLKFFAEMAVRGALGLYLDVTHRDPALAPIVRLRVASTSALAGEQHSATEPLAQLPDVLAFVEPGPGGSPQWALRMSKSFSNPSSWVTDAVQVLQDALSPA